MLKNKKIIYILLPAVLLIWGIIIFRIIKGVNPDINSEQIEFIANNNIETEVFTDTFKIIADYRDPFLGKIISNQNKKIFTNKNTNKNTNKKPVEEIKPEFFEQLPAMRYKGSIKNKKDNSFLAIIQFKNKKTLMRKNEVRKDVKVIAIFADSVMIEFNDRMYTLKK